MATDGEFDLEEEALNWEYSNFEWREHQELPFKKLEKLREVTIPNAYKEGFLKALELVSTEIVASCVSLKDSSEFTPEEHASWETVGQVIAIINKLKNKESK